MKRMDHHGLLQVQQLQPTVSIISLPVPATFVRAVPRGSGGLALLLATDSRVGCALLQHRGPVLEFTC